MRYYKRIDANGKTTTVESYSHDKVVEGTIEIAEQEYDEYLASLPPLPPPKPARDLGAEIDELKAQIELLKGIG